MGTAAASVGGSGSVRRRLRKSPFFTILGLMMLVLAIGGFWPQYFSAVTGRAPQATTQFWLIMCTPHCSLAGCLSTSRKRR